MRTCWIFWYKTGMQDGAKGLGGGVPLACTNCDRRRLNMNCGKKAMLSCRLNEAGSSLR